MFSYEIHQEADHTVLHIQGEAAIQSVSEALEVFRSFYAACGRLVLDLEKISATDVSFLQLVCSLHRSCVREGRELILSPQISKVFIDTMVAAGYLRFKGCKFAGSIPCLWQRREER